MFYRRKILLSLLQLCGDYLEKIRLHKLLFLYSQKKENPEYEFIPYKYGAYSFSASADLSTMVRKEYLEEREKGYFKRDKRDYLNQIKPNDKELLTEIFLNYGKMSNRVLIDYTYINFPFFAIRSKIAEESLTEAQYSEVLDVVPRQKERCLFTIGYEGISLEKYLNKLVENNIQLLVDVRRNPLSQKYGFSKSLLKRFCESLGIDYIHLPELGINSRKRQSLKSQEDYDQLFREYEQTTLKTTIEYQNSILQVLDKYNRIALTCFEANICQCHRLPLAKSLKSIDRKLLVKHI